MAKKEGYEIDFVVTWVNGSDPEWCKEKAKYEKHNDELDEKWNDSDIRYRDLGLFKYWFRSVEKYAPWVRNIFVVTNGQIPDFLKLDNEKVKIIKHSDIIPKRYLPTFNSNVIELYLCKIPGLSEHFVYFNDDVYLNCPTKKEDFFKEGLPMEMAGLDCVALDFEMGHADINDIKIINKNFNKRTALRRYWYKWFSFRNGFKQVLKTAILMPWEKFTGIHESHLTASYLKSVCEEVWAREKDNLLKTSGYKFRDDSNLNHWIFKYWQLVTGRFFPRGERFGRNYMSLDEEKEVGKDLRNQKYKVLCINDFVPQKSDDLLIPDMVRCELSKKFWKKSSYEK